MSYQDTRFKLPSETGGRIACLEASTGKRLWDRQAKYHTRPLINGLTVYAHGGAWDLLSGEERPFNLGAKSYGCGQLSGCEHMLFYRSGTLGYHDLGASSLGTQNYGGMRPGCWINAIPAGGLVLIPDASAGCQCSYLNRAWLRLGVRGINIPPSTAAPGETTNRAAIAEVGGRGPTRRPRFLPA